MLKPPPSIVVVLGSITRRDIAGVLCQYQEDEQSWEVIEKAIIQLMNDRFGTPFSLRNEQQFWLDPGANLWRVTNPVFNYPQFVFVNDKFIPYNSKYMAL